MKKIFLSILLVVSSFVIVACGGGTNNNNNNNNGDQINLGGEEFTIMVDNKNSTDPRLSSYNGLFKDEKERKINEVESKYNVKVVYENYPSNASWGGARERWIVEQSTIGKPAHVFQVASTSVAFLAVNNAILPLDDLIETYGVKGYWKEKLVFGQVFGKHYLYDDEYPYSDDGLYYNSDLLAEVLGEDRRIEPTKLWAEGKWTWDAFNDLANELKSKLDHNRSEEQGGPQYVMGGRTYNWFYPLIGANDAVLIDSEFNSNLSSDSIIEVGNFLANLMDVEGMWIDNAPLSNASQPEFTAGNVVFHNGMSWHLSASNKWANRDFEIDFVPYPAGPNIKEDMSNYGVTHVYGKSSYAISSAYSKENVPAGYEDKVIYDEIIFQIWNDLQNFDEIDPETGQLSYQDAKLDFYNVRLRPHYGSQESIDAHLEIFDMAKPDFFYSLSENQSHDANDSIMLQLQAAIKAKEVRTQFESLNAQINSIIAERFIK